MTEEEISSAWMRVHQYAMSGEDTWQGFQKKINDLKIIANHLDYCAEVIANLKKEVEDLNIKVKEYEHSASEKVRTEVERDILLG